MKNTLFMLALIATFVISWLIAGVVGYICSTGVSYHEVITNAGMIFYLTIIGWIPCVPVGIDLYARFWSDSK